MDLKRRWDVKDVDLPFIESPVFAKSKVERELSGVSYISREALSQLYEKAGGSRYSYVDDRTMIERIIKAVADGDLYLVLNDGFERLSSPLVEWDGQQWRARSFGLTEMGAQRLVESELPRLNARGLGPGEVAAQRFGSWGVTRPASALPPKRTPEPVVPEPSEETRILQIGVFFDGTGNNRENDRRLTDRDITNVAKLRDLYRYDGDDGDFHRVYIHGVGTINGHESEDGFVAPESTIGLALGLGAEGGHARIALALDRVRRILEDNQGAAVVFDVFGFSRGAALARHFVNLIHRWPDLLSIPDAYPHTPQSHVPTRHILGFPGMPLADRQVRFVGLFDTVGSFYWPGNDDDGDFDLYLAPSSARRVVHLTAHHEIRHNFPLTSIADALGNHPGNFVEIALPGAHSDVGGGYENPEVDFANYEELIVRRRGGLGTNHRTIRLAQMDAEKRGLTIRVEYPDVVEIERRATRKELAIYALHQMHREAQQMRVPLRPLLSSSPDHAIPVELQAIIDAWEREGMRRKRPWMLDVSRERFAGYIHTSHRQESLAHAPEPSGVRQVYPNVSRHSYLPAREVQDA